MGAHVTRPTEKRQREITEYVLDFFRRFGPADSDAPAAGFDRVSEWIYHTVERGTYTNVEVMFLIEMALLQYGLRVAVSGAEAGRLEERRTNASLRAFGEAVARACKLSAERDRAVARDVFEKLTEQGSNPAFAFYQALDAIGGRPPEGT